MKKQIETKLKEMVNLIGDALVSGELQGKLDLVEGSGSGYKFLTVDGALECAYVTVFEDGDIRVSLHSDNRRKDVFEHLLNEHCDEQIAKYEAEAEELRKKIADLKNKHDNESSNN